MIRIFNDRWRTSTSMAINTIIFFILCVLHFCKAKITIFYTNDNKIHDILIQISNLNRIQNILCNNSIFDERLKQVLPLIDGSIPSNLHIYNNMIQFYYLLLHTRMIYF